MNFILNLKRKVFLKVEAFIAIQNCYFNYDFEELNGQEDFPEELSISLRGMMYRHTINYPQASLYVYYSELLTGTELEKMTADFMRYCPVE